MFGTRGYHATSMEDIADRVGVSKPVLYRHFPGKLHLYRALAQEAADEMVTIVRAAMRGTSDNESRVDAAVRSYFDVVSAAGGSARLLFEIDARTAPEIAAVIEWATSSCVDAICDVVREETSLPSEQARLLAAGLVGLCTATARHWVSDGRTDRDDALALISHLAWRGISGFPRHPGDVAVAAQDTPLRRT
jgi:AcrR family transcriptional regulator